MIFRIALYKAQVDSAGWSNAPSLVEYHVLNMTEIASTLRRPPNVYLELVVTSTPRQGFPQTEVDTDEITLLNYLNSALKQYLGLTGTAIPLDILKVEGSHAWARLPAEDESAVVAALSQWASARGVALRVQSRSSWLGAVSRKTDDDNLWSLER